jgi:hypothetical protein
MAAGWNSRCKPAAGTIRAHGIGSGRDGREAEGREGAEGGQDRRCAARPCRVGGGCQERGDTANGSGEVTAREHLRRRTRGGAAGVGERQAALDRDRRRRDVRAALARKRKG